jgi:hypothetical protein
MPEIVSPPSMANNDADGGPKILAIGGASAARPPQGGAAPEGGESAGADWLEAARREAAHMEYDACFHAEAQFEACAEWERRSMRMGVLTAVLGALTASTIASVLGDAGVIPMAPTAAGGAAAHHLRDWAVAAKLPIAIGALVAGVITAAVRFVDPQGRAALHGAAGKRYRALQDEARQFRRLEATADAKRDGLLGRLQTMAKRRAEIHEAAPVIPKRAVATTRAKAKEGDDTCLRKLASEAGVRPG